MSLTKLISDWPLIYNVFFCGYQPLPCPAHFLMHRFRHSLLTNNTQWNHISHTILRMLDE